MKQGLLLATALSAALSSTPALADAETDALKQEVKALMARIDALEKRDRERESQLAKIKTGKPAAVASSSNSQLEQRVAVVERNQELAQDDAKAKAASTPTVEVGSKGFAITSPDKQYSVRTRGYIQADNRTFLNGSTTGAATDTFLIRAMRPIVEAKITDYFNGRVMIDFGRGNTTLLDAYGEFHPMPGNDLINFRAGEFKVPVGLERWQSEQELMFVERGPTTNLVPYRDIGLMAYGQLIPDQLEYQLAVLNGAADLQANTSDTDNTKDVAARVFAKPFSWAGIPALSGLGVGVGGTYGQHHGSASTPGLVAGYVSAGQRTYFNYRSASGQTVFADGAQWRLNPQLYYSYGPLGVMAEYVLNKQDVTRGTTSNSMRNDAWMAVASYVLTGEDASFDGVKPSNNFAPSKGQWGAFELAGRYGELNVDKKAFPFYADPAVSARSAREWVGGVNWYMNQSVKLNLDYAFTSFDGGAAAGRDRHDEQVILARTQLRF